MRRIHQNAQEIYEDGQRKIKIYKIEKFNSVFSTDKDTIGRKKFNLRRKNQNQMFKDSIGILQGLIEFIEGLIARKIDF